MSPPLSSPLAAAGVSRAFHCSRAARAVKPATVSGWWPQVPSQRFPPAFPGPGGRSARPLDEVGAGAEGPVSSLSLHDVDDLVGLHVEVVELSPLQLVEHSSLCIKGEWPHPEAASTGPE